MSGIVNSTGAKSGVIGITVGTPAGGVALQKIYVGSVETNDLAVSSSWTNIYETSLVLKSSTSKMIVEFDVGSFLNTAGAGGGVRIYRNTSATVTSSHTLVTPAGPDDGTGPHFFIQGPSGSLYVPICATGEDSLSGLTKDSTIYYAMLARKYSGGAFKCPAYGVSTNGKLNIILTEVET